MCLPSDLQRIAKIMQTNGASKTATNQNLRLEPVNMTLDSHIIRLTRVFSFTMVAWVFVFLISNYLNFWLDWPGVPNLSASIGILGIEPLDKPLIEKDLIKAWVQLGLYVLALVMCIILVRKTPGGSIQEDSEWLSDMSAYLIRACYWSVLLVGVV